MRRGIGVPTRSHAFTLVPTRSHPFPRLSTRSHAFPLVPTRSHFNHDTRLSATRDKILDLLDANRQRYAMNENYLVFLAVYLLNAYSLKD